MFILDFDGSVFNSDVGLTLQIEGIDDSLMERDVRAVCNDVMNIYEVKVAKVPPLGAKPVVLHKSPDDLPRACLNGLPSRYDINLTCLNTRNYAQIVYQLSHELGHIYINPYRNNRFIESCCCAMSYLCLKKMERKWNRNPPFPNWSTYARNFKIYRRDEIQKVLKERGIESENDVIEWIHYRVNYNWLNSAHEGDVDRPNENVCAVVIEQVLDEHQNSWGALTRLGEATSEDNITDFNLWRRLVTSEQKSLVDVLAERIKITR